MRQLSCSYNYENADILTSNIVKASSLTKQETKPRPWYEDVTKIW